MSCSIDLTYFLAHMKTGIRASQLSPLKWVFFRLENIHYLPNFVAVFQHSLDQFFAFLWLQCLT